MSALLDGFSVLFLHGLSCGNCESLRNEVVHTITGLNFYNFTGIAKVGYIFLE